MVPRRARLGCAPAREGDTLVLDNDERTIVLTFEHSTDSACDTLVFGPGITPESIRFGLTRQSYRSFDRYAANPYPVFIDEGLKISYGTHTKGDTPKGTLTFILTRLAEGDGPQSLRISRRSVNRGLPCGAEKCSREMHPEAGEDDGASVTVSATGRPPNESDEQG